MTATTATAAELKLAINGGSPVRDDDRPLPNREPRIIAPEVYDLVKGVLDSGFTLNLVSEFEREFAAACGVQYGVAQSNCTSVIHSVIGALELGPGDEVIVSPITDYGSVAGVVHQGATPVFPDVDPDTGLITAEHVEKVISPRTRAIIAVHFYGQICDMDPIIDLAQRHNIPVIEDVCQATFAEYKGRRAGSIGDVGCFSFDGGKLLPTDNGGMAVTDNRDLAEAIRFFGCRPRLPFRPLHSAGSTSGLATISSSATWRLPSGWPSSSWCPNRTSAASSRAERLSEKLRQIDGVSPPVRAPGRRGHVYWVYPVHFDLERIQGGHRRARRCAESGRTVRHRLGDVLPGPPQP